MNSGTTKIYKQMHRITTITYNSNYPIVSIEAGTRLTIKDKELCKCSVYV